MIPGINLTPDIPPEHVQSKNIVVIHPGSLNLRIGRASDLNPVTVLHAIARRKKFGGKERLKTFSKYNVIKKQRVLLKVLDDIILRRPCPKALILYPKDMDSVGRDRNNSQLIDYYCRLRPCYTDVVP